MARENLLVVDDEPDMRDALTAALRREGLCVSTAANGVEALEKVQGQSFDLIITDVRMPRMGGLALLQELKRTSAMIPVIMMTGYGRIEDAVEAMKAGAFDYLLKPFSLEDLKTVVMKALTPRNSPSSATVDTSRHDEQEYPESGASVERPIVTQDPRMLQVSELAKEAAQRWERARQPPVATQLAKLALRRGRDSNPRPTFPQVRDFQSRSLGQLGHLSGPAKRSAV